MKKKEIKGMELKQLSKNVYYIPGAVNIGVIVKGSSAVLIDTGIDDDAGKKILQTLKKENLCVAAIINTHSHADHIGGNSCIQSRTSARIYAPEHEAAVIHHPYFEPYTLFSGANPIKDMKNKFLMAKASYVDVVISNILGSLEVEGLELNVVGLPGHALNQIGVEFEGVFFCADSIFSADILSKHKIPFLIDVNRQKDTLAYLKSSQYNFYVPSHGDPTGDVHFVADTYMDILEGVEKLILDSTGEGKTVEELQRIIFPQLDISIKSPQQYYLLNTPFMAFLSGLHERGLVGTEVRNNLLTWVTV